MYKARRITRGAETGTHLAFESKLRELIGGLMRPSVQQEDGPMVQVVGVSSFLGRESESEVWSWSQGVGVRSFLGTQNEPTPAISRHPSSAAIFRDIAVDCNTAFRRPRPAPGAKKF